MAGEDDAINSLLFTSQQFNPVRALSSDQLLDVPSGARIFNNLKEYTDSLKDSASFRSLNWSPSELGIVPRPFDGPACLGHHGPGHRSKCDDNGGDTVQRRNLKRKAQSPPGLLAPGNNDLPSATGATDADLRSRLKKLSNAAIQRNTAPIHGARRSDDRSEKLKSLMTSDIESNEGKGKHKRVRRNVLQRMEECQQGPMSILQNCMNKGIKLKVWTRRYKGLRGVCVGYLIAFDKHMNLAMIDVDEIYTLEVRTLSLEEQAEIKKRKRTVKRNRNRLNRINREVKDIENKEAGLSGWESDRSSVPTVALDASEDLKKQKIIKKEEISKKVKGNSNEASEKREDKKLLLEDDDAGVVSDYFPSQREQRSFRSSDSEKMYKSSEDNQDSRHKKKARLKKDSVSHDNDAAKLSASEMASEIDRMSRSHKSRSRSESRHHLDESGKGDSEIGEASKDSRRRSRSHMSSKKERENSRERHKKKHHTSKKQPRSREGRRQSESMISLQTDRALQKGKTVLEDLQILIKEPNEEIQLKDDASSKGDKGPSCKGTEDSGQRKDSAASCTDRGEDTEKEAKRRIDRRVSESVPGSDDGAIEMNLVQEMPRDVVEKRTADTALEGVATSSKNDSDFNVSESSYEQMAKEDDPVTDSDDDHHNDKAITGCLKGIHDFAKGFHSTGIDEERSKDIKCKSRDKDHKGQLFQRDKVPTCTEENPVLSSGLKGGEHSQRTISLELKEEALSSNITKSSENSKSRLPDERVKFVNQLTAHKQVLGLKNRSSKENTRCDFMLFSGKKSRKSKLKPEQLLSSQVKTFKEQLKPDRRCTFSLFSNLLKRELLDGTDPSKTPQRLVKSKPEDLLRRSEKTPIIRESDQEKLSIEVSLEMKSEEIDECIQNVDTDVLCEAAVRNRQLSDSYDTEIESISFDQPLMNCAEKDAESTTQSTVATPICEPQSASDDSESDLSDKDDQEDHDSDKGNDTQTQVDHHSIDRDDERPDNCVSLEVGYKRDSDHEFNDGNERRPNSRFSSYNADNRETDHVFNDSDNTAKQDDVGSSKMVDIRAGYPVLDDSNNNREIDQDSNWADKRPHGVSSQNSNNRDNSYVFSDNIEQVHHDANDIDDKRPDNCFSNERVKDRKSDSYSGSSDETRKGDNVFGDNCDNREIDHDSIDMDDNRSENHISNDTVDHRESDLDSNQSDERRANCVSIENSNNKENDSDSDDVDYWNHNSDAYLAIVSNQIEMAIKVNANNPAYCPLPVKIIGNDTVQHNIVQTHASSSSRKFDRQSPRTTVEHSMGRNTATDAYEGMPVREINYELIRLELDISKGYEEMDASQFSSSNDPRSNLKDPRIRKMIQRKRSCSENFDAAEICQRRETKDNEDVPLALDREAAEFHIDMESREATVHDSKQSEVSEEALIELQIKSEVTSRPMDPRIRRPFIRVQEKILTENETKETVKEGFVDFKVCDKTDGLLADGACRTDQTATNEGIVTVTKSKVRDPRLRDPRLRRYSYHGERQSSDAKNVTSRSKSTESMEIVDEDEIRTINNESVSEENIEIRGNLSKDRTATDRSCGVRMLDDILSKLAATKRSKVGQSGIASSISVTGFADTANIKHDQDAPLLPDVDSNTLLEKVNSEIHDQFSDVLDERDTGKAGNSQNFTGNETTQHVAVRSIVEGKSGGANDASESLHAGTSFDSAERKDYLVEPSTDYSFGNKQGDNVKGQDHGEVQNDTEHSNETAQYQNYDESNCISIENKTFVWEPKAYRVEPSTDYSFGNKQGDNVKGQDHREVQNDTEHSNETAQYQNYDESNCISIDNKTFVWEPQPSITIYRNERADKGTQRRTFDLPTVSANFDPLLPIPGHVLRRRHVNQLFIRGDNIALVAYDKIE